MKFRTISEGSYSAATPAAAEAHLATDAEAFDQLWTRLIGRGTKPDVDFGNEVVVILLAGEQRTGGYSIEPKSATVDAETLVVDADVKGPEPGTMVTQALTSPWEIIAVSRRDVKSVRWTR